MVISADIESISWYLARGHFLLFSVKTGVPDNPRHVISITHRHVIATYFLSIRTHAGTLIFYTSWHPVGNSFWSFRSVWRARVAPLGGYIVPNDYGPLPGCLEFH